MVQNGGSELTEVKMTSEGGGVFQSVLKKNQVYTIFCTRPTTCEFWSNMRSVRADLSRPPNEKKQQINLQASRILANLGHPIPSSSSCFLLENTLAGKDKDGRSIILCS